jgi:hypothetical protein
LIENRDEYLRHSSKNYTAEQKQYNNRLTEELLEVAEEYHYVFDPEDFNFVAIRDRIRCYYKSYVQTARKRGLQVSSIPPSKKQKVKKESKGTDTEADIKDDLVTDKETDDKQSDEIDEDDKKIEVENKEADTKVEEKDDVVIDKETDDKKSDEMDEDDKKIDEEKAGEKKIGEEKALLIEESKADEEYIDEKATAEKKIDETTEMKIDETAEKKIDETAEKTIDENESVDKVFSDKKTGGEGAAEELENADAKEAHTIGVGKAA